MTIEQNLVEEYTGTLVCYSRHVAGDSDIMVVTQVTLQGCHFREPQLFLSLQVPLGRPGERNAKRAFPGHTSPTSNRPKGMSSARPGENSLPLVSQS